MSSESVFYVLSRFLSNMKGGDIVKLKMLKRYEAGEGCPELSYLLMRSRRSKLYFDFS